MMMNSRDMNSAMLLLLGIVFAQALFIPGYGIRVIRHLMDGNEKLPSLEIVGDIGRGFAICIAGIFYFLPLFLVFFCGAMAGAFGTPSYYNASNSAGSAIVMIVVLVVFGVYLSWGFTVGMTRYAAEESVRALFQAGRNFTYVNSNIGTSFGLTFRQFVIGIIYVVAVNAYSFIYNNVVGGMINYRTDLNIIILLITIGYIISTTLNLLQQFANLHLMYQYADVLGIGRGDEKLKHQPNPMKYDG